MDTHSFEKHFFLSFEDNEMMELINVAQKCVFEEDEYIFIKGDKSNAFYIISSGFVQIYSTKNGKEMLFPLIGSGRVLGEIAFFDKKPRTASAKAFKKTDALLISDEAFAKLEKENPLLAIKILKELGSVLAKRLRLSDEIIVDFATTKIDDKFLERINDKK